MANTLSLHLLLDGDKLIGPNFDSWYRKLKIILEHKRIFYVIMDPESEEPALSARGALRDIYQKWLNDRTTVRCIMWATFNDEFSHKFEDVQQRKYFKY